MVLFEIFKSKKSYQNIHQNAPNCTIFKNFLVGGACPRTPLAKRMASPCAACYFATCKFPNLKKTFLGPPPSQILVTPLHNIVLCDKLLFLIKSNPQRQLKTVDIRWNITLHICKKKDKCV